MKMFLMNLEFDQTIWEKKKIEIFIVYCYKILIWLASVNEGFLSQVVFLL